MYIDPVRHSGRPTDDRIPQEMAIYDELERQGISFERVDHDHADTMEDCRKIEEVLDAKICKNLFLCNRQKTQFYLLLMPGNKPFHTKDLTGQLGCSRLSFAGEEPMHELLGVTPGSVSVLGLLNDTENRVRLVIDRDVLQPEFFACHPCRNTSSLRIATADLTGRILPALRHEPDYVSL